MKESATWRRVPDCRGHQAYLADRTFPRLQEYQAGMSNCTERTYRAAYECTGTSGNTRGEPILRKRESRNQKVVSTGFGRERFTPQDSLDFVIGLLLGVGSAFLAPVLSGCAYGRSGRFLSYSSSYATHSADGARWARIVFPLLIHGCSSSRPTDFPRSRWRYEGTQEAPRDRQGQEALRRAPPVLTARPRLAGSRQDVRRRRSGP